MITPSSTVERQLAIQRLTALWALNECGLGGILHAFNSAFTGLIVGSFAMVCIAMICSLAENKWKTVMSALLTVLIIKALVSPHSSPTSYVAVAFQGVTGALIYRLLDGKLVGSLLYFSLGHLESGCQRLIMLTLFFGNSLWKSINIWGEWVEKNWGVILPFSSSQILIYTYLLIHFCAGILMGWLTWRTIATVKKYWGFPQYQIVLKPGDKKELLGQKRSRLKKFILPLLILFLIPLSWYQVSDSAGALSKGGWVFLRVLIIVILWFGFIAPLLMRLLRNVLRRKSERMSGQIEQAMEMFPRLLWLLDKARKEAYGTTWIGRWKNFMLLSILYTLQFRIADDTDPDRTGAEL